MKITNSLLFTPLSETATHPLHAELGFTKIYRKYLGAPAPVREAHCWLEHMKNAVIAPEPEDGLLGRVTLPSVGISPEYPLYGYYCVTENNVAAPTVADKAGKSEKHLRDAYELAAFWSHRETITQIRQGMTPEMHALFPYTGSRDWTVKNAASFVLMRLAGIHLDHRQSVKLGLPGLIQKVESRLNDVPEYDWDTRAFIEGIHITLTGLTDLLNAWAREVESLAKREPETRKKQIHLAKILRQIAVAPPATYEEALQFTYLLSTVTGVTNHGRMDIYLGEFLERDLNEGRLTWDDAREITLCLWKIMNDTKFIANHRILIGGRGRPNESSADLFAKLAMETHELCHDILPSLTLKLSKNQNPELLEQALNVIGKGNTQPMLLNDDVNVPAVAKAFNISEKEAEDYLPYGCGEYIIWNKSVGTPNGVINLPKILERVLTGGLDLYDEVQYPDKVGDLESYETFEKLRSSYSKLIDSYSDQLAAFQHLFYDISRKTLSFPLISLLMDDCVTRGKSVLGGGVRYPGGTNETFGNITAADSLEAIRKLVFKEKRIPKTTLLAALRANFKGYEDIREQLQAVPKFGNDDPKADESAVWLHETVCTSNRKCAARHNLHHFLVVVINNSANVIFGRTTCATADGRLAGQALSNGNTPSAGNDVSGLTAVMNSIVKLDPSIHAGAVHNFKFSPKTLNQHRAEVLALFKTYFKNGGTQAMLTCVDRSQLLDAFENPERHPHLMVRTGGFSARFVELPRDVQEHIINRTEY